MEVITALGAVGSIVNIVDGINRTVGKLRDARCQWNYAELTTSTLVVQLNTLRAALDQVADWISSGRVLEEHHEQLVIDLEDSTSCCQALIESIESHVAKAVWTPESKLAVRSKVDLLTNERSIRRLQEHIERQTCALTLLLTACACTANTARKPSLEKPVETDEDSLKKGSPSSLLVKVDEISPDGESIEMFDNGSKFSQAFPGLDAELLASPVYQKAFRSVISPKHERKSSDNVIEKHAMGKDRKRESNTFVLKSFLSAGIADFVKGSARKFKSMMHEHHAFLFPVFRVTSAGTDTIFRQLTGFAPEISQDDEVRSFRARAFDRIDEGLNALLNELESVDTEVLNLELPDLGAIRERQPIGYDISGDTVDLLEKLWECVSNIPGVEAWLKKTNPSFSYFLSRIRFLSSPCYTPTAHETTLLPRLDRKLSETVWVTEDGFRARLTDCRSTIPSRKAVALWQCYAIMLVIDLATITDPNPLDPSQTQWQATEKLFRKLAKLPNLYNVPIVLVAGNADIFEKNLRRVPLRRYFKEYTDGGEKWYDAAAWLLSRLIRQDPYRRKSQMSQRQIHTFFSFSTDSHVMENNLLRAKEMKGLLVERRLHLLSCFPAGLI